MPFYHKLGKIPHKRHTSFKKEGGGLHYEELFGTIGFDGMSSLLYHLQRPTQVKEIKDAYLTNTLSVENATYIANQLDIPLLYISTEIDSIFLGHILLSFFCFI